MSTHPDVRRLLAALLPLETVGPALRRAARQAVASGDRARMRRVALAVVGEMIRRGDLVRVAVEGRAGEDWLYLRRGGMDLLDLAALAPGAPEPAEAGPETAPAPAPALDEDALGRLLLALTHDQGPPLGEPMSAHRQVVLEAVLELLARALPSARFAIALADELDPDLPSRRVVGLDRREPPPLWAAHRQAGACLWVPSLAEVPPRLRQALAPAGEVVGPGAPPAAAGAPLLAPPAEGGPADEPPSEAGLLFMAAPVSRPALLRMARLSASFVTARWRQHLTLTRLVHADSLTGVHNRAYFDGQLVLELERARRQEAPLSLVLADIDHFKRINDAWGHPVGDWVLRTVARELQGALRRIDLVCRIGGEEFALILPDTPASAALDVCLRLLERLDRIRMTAPGVPEPLRVNLSFGGVTFPEGGTEASELYRKADGMLYLSKRQGRKRCTFWNPAGEPLVLTVPAAPAG